MYLKILRVYNLSLNKRQQLGSFFGTQPAHSSKRKYFIHESALFQNFMKMTSKHTGITKLQTNRENKTTRIRS